MTNGKKKFVLKNGAETIGFLNNNNKKRKLEFTYTICKIVSNELTAQMWKAKLKITEDNAGEYFHDFEVCKDY